MKKGRNLAKASEKDVDSQAKASESVGEKKKEIIRGSGN